ncbi:MAG: hypothetical protein HQL37_08420 [Alphaproteobacteria bacterium]|nr:hypothetical protein [Alphaproteobacteria bacterium]
MTLWLTRLFRYVGLAFGLAVSAVGVPAGAESGRQILVLETGMHRGPVLRTSTDSAGTRLATVAEDGTARLWSLPDGNLLRTFRTPIGASGIERLDAVALSPDGTLLATAGTRAGDEVLPALYVFDTGKGTLVRRLRDLPNRINHLTFSRDGQFLAASMASHSGVRVFKTQDWTPAGSDGGYGSDSYWAEFNGDGRLATTSLDGMVRLYGPDFHPLAKMAMGKGKHPYGLAFSPDGQMLAIGYVDSTKVDVLSARDLSLLFSPDSASATNGTLNSVAWSADGRTLMAGGRYGNPAGTRLLRLWRDSGHGAATDVPATRGTIMDICAFKGGGVAIGAADPAIRIIPTPGAKAVELRSGIPDYRTLGAHFTVSADGHRLGFALRTHGALFTPAEPRLLLDPPPDSTLVAPQATGPGIKISDWQDHRRHPSINGHVLPFDTDERQVSLAVGKSHHVLIGTTRHLRLFDDKGASIWQQPVPGTPWAVNAAENGRVAVAAYGDGTIRWHRLSDGHELLALFAFEDGKRWVAWTPSGYYAASPDGDDLLGWQIDNGRDAAPDFMPVSRLRDRFRRPDILAKVFDTLDETQAVGTADKASGRPDSSKDGLRSTLPPVVTIRSPKDGATMAVRNVTFEYTLASRSEQPVTKVWALIDGRPVPGSQGEEDEPEIGKVQRLTFPVPPRPVTVTLMAKTANAPADPATVQLRGQGTGPPGTPTPAAARLLILAVGTEGREGAHGPETVAARDAGRFVDALRAHQGAPYHTITARLLADDKAGRDAVTSGLDWLHHEATVDDVVLVLWRGPIIGGTDGQAYFLAEDTDPTHPADSGFSVGQVRDALKALSSKVALILDPSLRVGTHPADLAQVAKDIATTASGILVLTAASSGENPIMTGHDGAFVTALVEGLPDTIGPDHIQPLTMDALGQWMAERVPQLTGDTQHPHLWHPPTVPDFPLVTPGTSDE